MIDVLAVTAPIYLLIALGYAVTRAGLLDGAQLRALGRYVVFIALPALMFGTVSRRSIDELLNARFLMAYALGSVLALALAYGHARRLRGAPASLAAMHGLGASLSNTGYIGLPIALQALGPAAAGPVAMAFIVENLLVMPLAFALADATQGRKPAAAMVETLRGLVRNPIVVSVCAGLVAALVGLQLPALLERTVSMVAASATPVALVAVGGSLVGQRLVGVRLDLAAVAVGKLLLHPIAVWVALWVLVPGDPALQAAGALLAAMPMFGIYPLLAQRWGHQGFCAAALLVTVIASFATINVALWLLSRMG